VSRLGDAIEEVENARKPTPQHPSGWEPGVTWDGKSGNILAATSNKSPDWAALLSAWDMDPDVVEVIEPVQMRSWDAAIGNGEVRRMYYYKASIRRKRGTGPDIDDLVKGIRKHKARKYTPQDGDTAFLLALADLQVGKKGTAEVIDAMLRSIDAHAQRLKALRKCGHRIDDVYIACLGDLIESCDGHYDMQTFEVELDEREQRRLARHVVMYAVERFAPLAARLIIVAVPGNHGENRKDGKSFTSFGDNSDLEVPEAVGEACRTNPDAFGHCSFVIPQKVMTVTLDIAGVIVGFAHGHQARSGTNASKKVENWWSGQAFGNRPVGDAAILLSGHYHSLDITEHSTDRTHIQCPTMDAGSQWYAETAGNESMAGMLSLCIGKHFRQGWDELKVI